VARKPALPGRAPKRSSPALRPSAGAGWPWPSGSDRPGRRPERAVASRRTAVL